MIPRGVEPGHGVEPPTLGGLHERRQPDRLEQLPQRPGDRAQLGHRRVRRRIDVHDDPVRALQLLHCGQPDGSRRAGHRDPQHRLEHRPDQHVHLQPDRHECGGDEAVTLTGTITAVLFAGDTAVEVIVGATINTLACLSPPGITSRFGVTTLTIT
jgi:hypothetical protein